jgi:hypothetical protein
MTRLKKNPVKSKNRKCCNGALDAVLSSCMYEAQWMWVSTVGLGQKQKKRPRKHTPHTLISPLSPIEDIRA